MSTSIFSTSFDTPVEDEGEGTDVFAGWSLDDLLAERADTSDPVADLLAEEIEDDEETFGADEEDLALEAELLLHEDEEDEDVLEEVLPRNRRPTRSRVVLANRVRAARDLAGPDDLYGIAYARGYMDALRAAGAEEEAEEAFGALIPLLGAAVAAPLLKGALGGQETSTFFENLGKGIGSQLGIHRATPSSPKKKKVPVPAALPKAAVEADGADLPPVYVADTPGAKDVLKSVTESPDVAGKVAVADTFGTTAQTGWMDRQVRRGAYDAVDKAVSRGGEALRVVRRPGAGAIFVEDMGARPYLFADGGLWDAVYGALQAVPCPSCSTVHFGAVEAGHTLDCGVCDGYGALLIPEGDTDSFLGVRYGIIPLIPAIFSLGSMVGTAVLAHEGYKAYKKSKEAPPRKKKRKKRSHTATDATDRDLASLELDLASIPEAETPVEAMGRLIVPEAWWRTRFGT